MAKIYHEHDRSIPPFDQHFATPGFLPVTPALISVADDVTGIPNIMPAVGWGWLNRLPFYLGVAVSVEEHTFEYYRRGSHELLHRARDFAVNFPTDRLREQVAECGRLSRGKDPTVDKFKETGLTAALLGAAFARRTSPSVPSTTSAKSGRSYPWAPTTCSSARSSAASPTARSARAVPPCAAAPAWSSPATTARAWCWSFRA